MREKSFLQLFLFLILFANSLEKFNILQSTLKAQINERSYQKRENELQ
jgi:hypothetical protein